MIIIRAVKTVEYKNIRIAEPKNKKNFLRTDR